MDKKPFIKKIENLPFPILATMVGFGTLGNLFGNLGYTAVRHISMISGTIIWILYALKIILYPKTVGKEYKNTVPASLYAGFTMLLMLISSYYMKWIPEFKYLIITAVLVHAVHIVVFTFNNVFKNFCWDTFVPSWFVTYNGIMVSTVVAGKDLPPMLAKIIVYYGISIYFILLVFKIYRFSKYEFKDQVYHTQAIMVAPASLVLVSYFNVIGDAVNHTLVYALYFCILASLLLIVVKFSKFVSYKFSPAFAGLTFPTAIACVATSKMSGFLASQGQTALAEVLNQIYGIQLYTTVAIIAYVVYNFVKMYFDSLKPVN